MESCKKQNKENFLENRLIWQDSAPEYQHPSEDEDVRDWAEWRHSEATARKEILDAEMSRKGLKFEYRSRRNPLADEEVVSDGYVDQSHVMRADRKELPGQDALKYKMELFLSRDVLDPEGGSLDDIVMPGVRYFEKEVRDLIASAPMKGRADVFRDNMNMLVSMYDAVLDDIDWKLESGEDNRGLLIEYQNEIEQKRRDAEMLLAANTDDGLDALKKELGLSE